MTNSQLTLYLLVKIFLLRSETRQGYLFSLFLVNVVLENLSRAISQDKEIKGTKTRKKEVQLSLFVDDMILHIENPKDSTKKKTLLKSINEFSKVAVCKINIQKLAIF